MSCQNCDKLWSTVRVAASLCQRSDDTFQRSIGGTQCITYGGLDRLFKHAESCPNSCSKNVGKTVRDGLIFIDPRVECYLPKKMSNLKRVIDRHLTKDQTSCCLTVDSLYPDSQSVIIDQNFVGEYCNNLGIVGGMLEPPEPLPMSHNRIAGPIILPLNQGSIVELFRYAKAKGYPVYIVGKWLETLMTGTSTGESTSRRYARVAFSIRDRAESLSKHYHRFPDKIISFMLKEFVIPLLPNSVSTPQQDQQPTGTDPRPNDNSNQIIQELLQQLQEMHDLQDTYTSDWNNFLVVKDELISQKAKYENLSEGLLKKMKKLSNAKKVTKNLKRNLRRKNKTLASVESRLDVMEKEQNSTLLSLGEKDAQVTALNQKLGEAIRLKKNAINRLVYFKSVIDNNSTGSVNDRTGELENQCVVLEDEIKTIKSSAEYQCYKNGKYDHVIREVYQDLMFWNVGAMNVSNIVRTVLKKCANIDCGRLPSATFAKYMILEGRALAQLQIGDRLIDTMESNLTLHLDGTSRFGKHYGHFGVASDGQDKLTFGVTGMVSGEAEMYLNELKRVIDEICKMYERLGKTNQHWSEKIFSKIKNTMTDRATVQKRFNDILSDYRNSILPDVINGWNDMETDEKDALSRMHNFFCGFHFVLGLGDQAETASKAFDELMFNGEKVGTLAKGGYTKGDSGTLRLIRTVCKAVQLHGCEKSGRIDMFANWLRQEKGIDQVPLKTFRGNRFNITFENAAGISYIYPHLLEFFSQEGDENRLLTAVDADLNVPEYRAFCRAMGLVHKLVTQPLMRELFNFQTNILSMSPIYTAMVNEFDRLSADATDVMDGTLIIFPGAKVDRTSDIYNSLVMDGTEVDWPLVKSALEMMFASFSCVGKRMLVDHLPGGKYHDVCDDVQNEIKSCCKSNIFSENDFGLLDRVMREKPHMLEVGLDAFVIVRRNKTCKWRDGLDEAKKREFMECARMSVKCQRQEFIVRQRELLSKRADLIHERFKNKEMKAIRDRVRKESLTVDLQLYGGLWLNDADVVAGISQFGAEKDRKKSLMAQINYRRHVLGFKSDNRDLIYASSQGRIKLSDELAENLVEIIRISDQERDMVEGEPVTDDAMDTGIRNVDAAKLHHAVERLKIGVKRKSSAGCIGAPLSKKRGEDGLRLPVVNVLEDLEGKLVEHCCQSDGTDGWYRAVVVTVSRQCIKIRYDVEQDGLYTYSRAEIETDWTDNDIKLVEISSADFLGKEIDHLVEDDGDEEWWRAKVLHLITEGDNPYFQLAYEVTDENYDMDNVYEFPLVEDYLNGDLKFV